MKDLLVSSDISIQAALKTMSEAGEKCLVVTDDRCKMAGTLSDGDLRKAILNGKRMVDSVESIYNPNATFFRTGRFSMQEAREEFIQHRFELIPVLNDDHEVVDILYWDEVFKNFKEPEKRKINSSAVIMAGGRGTRLEPFTKVLPKPLVPVHDKPIIEHIIERFTEVGVDNFYVTVNYKSRILKAYFEELQPDYTIHFVEEEKPLGTAGSLRFLTGTFDSPFLFSNCDIIVKADYVDIYSFHQNHAYDITLVASMMNYIIPYGTCELNGHGHLDRIREKPEYNFLVNTGLYVINPEMLNYIPADRKYHVTELIADAKRKDLKVGVYPVADDAWIDVGQWTEYRKALERL